jgi:hypothetical protein
VAENSPSLELALQSRVTGMGMDQAKLAFGIECNLTSGVSNKLCNHRKNGDDCDRRHISLLHNIRYQSVSRNYSMGGLEICSLPRRATESGAGTSRWTSIAVTLSYTGQCSHYYH